MMVVWTAMIGLIKNSQEDEGYAGDDHMSGLLDEVSRLSITFQIVCLGYQHPKPLAPTLAVLDVDLEWIE